MFSLGIVFHFSFTCHANVNFKLAMYFDLKMSLSLLVLNHGRDYLSNLSCGSSSNFSSTNSKGTGQAKRKENNQSHLTALENAAAFSAMDVHALSLSFSKRPLCILSGFL